jgi:DNA-binding NarL/FixJ family response regulator
LGATGRGVPASGGASTTADAPLGAEHERLLTLVARGLSDRQIGAEVALSWHTVNHRIKQLCRLLGVRNRTELAAWAAVHGLYARADPAGGDLHLLRA